MRAGPYPPPDYKYQDVAKIIRFQRDNIARYERFAAMSGDLIKRLNDLCA